jgi:hypothetical protein
VTLTTEKEPLHSGRRSRGAVAVIGSAALGLAGTISGTILGTAGFPVT